jgi:hypothetical protein
VPARARDRPRYRSVRSPRIGSSALIPDDGLAYDDNQLDKWIGPGGYSGTDLHIGARVAIKILNACMHEHLLGFFGQEIRVAARRS